MSPLVIALLIGALSGVIAALCGVGGGVVMVPLFVMLLKMGQKQAVATSLAAMILTAVFASVRNQSNGFVNWKVALACGIGGAAVAWFAADALKHLSNETLTRIFGVVLVIMGVKMLLFK